MLCNYQWGQWTELNWVTKLKICQVHTQQLNSATIVLHLLPYFPLQCFPWNRPPIPAPPHTHTHRIHRSILSIGCSVACIDHVCACLFNEYDTNQTRWSLRACFLSNTHLYVGTKKVHTLTCACKGKVSPAGLLSNSALWLTIAGIVPWRNISFRREWGRLN